MQKLKRRNKRKKQRNILILSTILISFTLITAYSAFSTSLTLTAKGNLIENTAKNILTKKTTTTGDGLYKDDYAQDRYIFKGQNVDNYIMFNEELYRIIALEPSGSIKIIKNTASVNNINFDDATTPRYNANGYCTDSSGCNLWASKTTLLDKNKQNTTTFTLDTTKYAVPEQEAKANRYLNSTGEYANDGFYYNLKEESKNLIIKNDFAIGAVKSSEMQNIITEENQYYWNGYIGLISISDYKKSLNNEDTYLHDIDTWYWVINPTNNNRALLWAIWSRTGRNLHNGTVYYGTGSSVGIVPTFYLKPDIKITGKGTQTNPYQIEK